MYEVRVAPLVLDKAHERYGDERSPVGAPSEYDFVGGPLAAALLVFRHFDELPEAARRPCRAAQPAIVIAPVGERSAG